MGVVGKYVATFAEATHALPEGMHMNADYPFMIPKVELGRNGRVTLVASRGSERQACEILKRGNAEICKLKQSSGFERMFRRPPTEFVFHPFKGEPT